MTNQSTGTVLLIYSSISTDATNLICLHAAAVGTRYSKT